MADEKRPKVQENEFPKKLRMDVGGSPVDLYVNSDGSVDMPDELRQLLEAGAAVMQQAESKQQVTAIETNEPEKGKNGAEGSPDAGDKFRGLPMSELIGNPLYAAAEAQQRLAGVAWDFYQKIAYDTEKTKDDQGHEKETKSTRLLKFDLERPVVQDGVVGQTLKQKVSAPFIGLVPIPSLLIDHVDIDFQMEVTDTNVSKSTTNTDTNASVSSKWFGVTASVSGKVSTNRENTRSTNQTAKYQVHVSASQQPQTEGLSKLMDIMAACIESVEQKDGSDPSPKPET